ncbi:hypothetical protein [Thauera aromatica]|nr:hypothetical protein [Thauera aromatica]MCK2096378.1 hypothetical protein [Thauera aromatica]
MVWWACRPPFAEGLIYKAFALTWEGRSGMIRRLFLTVPDLSGLSLRAFPLSALLVPAFGLLPSLVSAALPRMIPDEAAKVKMRFSPAGLVHIEDRALRLSPGAQIRDTGNRIVLPAYVRGEHTVRVLLDNNGQVHRVWILTPHEAAAPVPGR